MSNNTIDQLDTYDKWGMSTVPPPWPLHRG